MVDNERRQRIQDMILQQRMNRYQSASKSKSKPKSKLKQVQSKKNISPPKNPQKF